MPSGTLIAQAATLARDKNAQPCRGFLAGKCKYGHQCKKGYHDVKRGYEECAKGFEAVKEQCEDMEDSIMKI